MFDSDIKRRLSTIESCLDKQKSLGTTAAVVEAELSTKLHELATAFKEYTSKEEVFMRSYIRREEEASKENMQALHEIKLDLQSIKSSQAAQPKEVAFELSKFKTQTDEEYRKLFASKKEISNIGKHLRYIWLLLAVGFLLYFGNEKLLVLLSFF